MVFCLRCFKGAGGRSADEGQLDLKMQFPRADIRESPDDLGSNTLQHNGKASSGKLGSPSGKGGWVMAIEQLPQTQTQPRRVEAWPSQADATAADDAALEAFDDERILDEELSPRAPAPRALSVYKSALYDHRSAMSSFIRNNKVLPDFGADVPGGRKSGGSAHGGGSVRDGGTFGGRNSACGCGGGSQNGSARGGVVGYRSSSVRNGSAFASNSGSLRNGGAFCGYGAGGGVGGGGGGSVRSGSVHNNGNSNRAAGSRDFSACCGGEHSGGAARRGDSSRHGANPGGGSGRGDANAAAGDGGGNTSDDGDGDSRAACASGDGGGGKSSFQAAASMAARTAGAFQRRPPGDSLSSTPLVVGTSLEQPGSLHGSLGGPGGGGPGSPGSGKDPTNAQSWPRTAVVPYPQLGGARRSQSFSVRSGGSRLSRLGQQQDPVAPLAEDAWESQQQRQQLRGRTGTGDGTMVCGPQQRRFQPDGRDGRGGAATADGSPLYDRRSASPADGEGIPGDGSLARPARAVSFCQPPPYKARVAGGGGGKLLPLSRLAAGTSIGLLRGSAATAAAAVIWDDDGDGDGSYRGARAATSALEYGSGDTSVLHGLPHAYGGGGAAAFRPASSSRSLRVCTLDLPYLSGTGGGGGLFTRGPARLRGLPAISRDDGVQSDPETEGPLRARRWLQSRQIQPPRGILKHDKSAAAFDADGDAAAAAAGGGAAAQLTDGDAAAADDDDSDAGTESQADGGDADHGDISVHCGADVDRVYGAIEAAAKAAAAWKGQTAAPTLRAPSPVAADPARAGPDLVPSGPGLPGIPALEQPRSTAAVLPAATSPRLAAPATAPIMTSTTATAAGGASETVLWRGQLPGGAAVPDGPGGVAAAAGLSGCLTAPAGAAAAGSAGRGSAGPILVVQGGDGDGWLLGKRLPEASAATAAVVVADATASAAAAAAAAVAGQHGLEAVACSLASWSFLERKVPPTVMSFRLMLPGQSTPTAAAVTATATATTTSTNGSGSSAPVKGVVGWGSGAPPS